MCGVVLSVNVGVVRASTWKDVGETGIDKRPVEGPVEVSEPGPKGSGAVGLAGDRVCDTKHHGGTHQAIYAYAREDLDEWAAELGRPLAGGAFGENLTTSGIDVTGARIGERWRIGERLVLEVSAPRIPCGTFQGWLGEQGWVARFNERAKPGAYLRVIEPGPVAAGDPIDVVSIPGHDVTVSLALRALTIERHRLAELAPAHDALPPEAQALLARRA